MEKEIVITKRFRRFLSDLSIWLKTSHQKQPFFFWMIEERIELISKHPSIGKESRKKSGVRSIQLTHYNLLFYRVKK